jgi:hypothetical protein
MSDQRIHLAGEATPPAEQPLSPGLDGHFTGDPLRAAGPAGRKASAPQAGRRIASNGPGEAAQVMRDEPRPASPEQGRGGYGDSNLLPLAEVHLTDYVRVLYKRRWAATTAFLVVFVSVVVYTFTQTPIFAARAQLLIEPENPNVISFKEVIERTSPRPTTTRRSTKSCRAARWPSGPSNRSACGTTRSSRERTGEASVPGS